MDIQAISAANPLLSAGYWYRMVQPMKELEVNIVTHPDALKVIFACWNDMRPEHYVGRYILDFDDLIWDQPHRDDYDVQRLFEIMRGAVHITTASPKLLTAIVNLGRMPVVSYCRTGVSDEYYPMVLEPDVPVVAWRGSRGWRRALKWCQPYLPEDIAITQGLPFKDYMKMLRTYDRTVEVCPSYPGAFEACKSNIKLIQALHQGVPVVASALAPYGFAAREASQLVYHDPNEIPELLAKVLNDSELRNELSIQGRAYTQQHWRAANTAKDFESVWSRYV